MVRVAVAVMVVVVMTCSNKARRMTCEHTYFVTCDDTTVNDL